MEHRVEVGASGNGFPRRAGHAGALLASGFDGCATVCHRGAMARATDEGTQEKQSALLGEVQEPSPESPNSLQQQARRQIRARMRALRGAYPEALLSARSQRIVESIGSMEAYRSARSLALYYPLPSEVDLRSLDRLARSEGKRVFYPFLEPRERGFSTGFAQILDLSELADRGRRFWEPPPDAPRARPGDVDLVLVPALAVSSQGHRLGYGSGFYDATLPEFCPPARSVVVAFDFQLLGELPTLQHDVACDLVLTDGRLLTRSA